MKAPPRSTPQLTDWLPGTKAPAHEGVYRRRPPAGPFSCWAQGRWWGDAERPDDAAREHRPSQHQAAAWRGLAQPSAEPCLLCRGHGVIDRHGEGDDEARIEECPEC